MICICFHVPPIALVLHKYIQKLICYLHLLQTFCMLLVLVKDNQKLTHAKIQKTIVGFFLATYGMFYLLLRLQRPFGVTGILSPVLPY